MYFEHWHCGMSRQQRTRASNLCDTLSTIREAHQVAHQMATVGYPLRGELPPHCTSPITYESISDEKVRELWRIERQWRIQQARLLRQAWYQRQKHLTEVSRVNRMPPTMPPRLRGDPKFAPAFETHKAVPLSKVTLPPMQHSDTDAASEVGSTASYFTERWLPSDLQL